MGITKAIIPVAGYGTRRLPITKAVEKCMLPICNRPIIDFSVEACVLNGITDIYFIVSPDHMQLKTYYGSNKRLEKYLTDRGKLDVLKAVTNIRDEATFHYIMQQPTDPYGTAVPIWLAREALANDSHFVVMMGDDFLFNPRDPGINLRRMIDVVEKQGAPSAIAAVPMPRERMTRYASLRLQSSTNGIDYIDGIVEKPRPDEITSDLANISTLLLNHDIFTSITEVMRAPNSHGEHYLTDAVNDYVAGGGRMAAVRTEGQHLDGGNLAGWIEANNIVFAELKHHE